MIIRQPHCLAIFAMAACFVFASGALANPQMEFPAMPIDPVVDSAGDFAAFATNSTPIEPDVPTTGAGSDDVNERSPEPATLTLLGLGGFGAWWSVRRRKSA